MNERSRLGVAAAVLALAAACSSSSGGGLGASPDAGGDDASADLDASAGDADAIDAARADAEAGACSLVLSGDASACDVCKSQKCCRTTAAARAKPGSWTNSAALICAENECATECGLPAAKCGGITPDPASCLDALDAKCCGEVTACGQSDECVAVVYLCIDDQGNAPGSPGFANCAATYPNGRTLFNTMNDCFVTVTCP